jgi:hypothetical protein
LSDDSPWRTAKQVFEEVPDDPDYLVEQIMVLGVITEFTATIKAGKSTFISKAVWSALHGEEIIGLQTRRSPILWLTEEGPSTFRKLLLRASLQEESDLHILHRGNVWRMEWPEIVRDIVVPKVKESGARYVIVDTISRWANIKGDEENQTGAAQTAMEPLEALRDAGLGVTMVRHARKAGGEIGDSARGASAWGGAADVLVKLQNPNTEGHPNRRVIETLGRLDDPAKWTVELKDGYYEVVGRGDVVERERIKNDLVQLHGTGKYTIPDLVKLLNSNYSTVERALKLLLPAGVIKVTGGTSNRDPKVYEL